MLLGNVEAREIENLAIAVLDLARDVGALNEGWEVTAKQLAETSRNMSHFAGAVGTAAGLRDVGFKAPEQIVHAVQAQAARIAELGAELKGLKEKPILAVRDSRIAVLEAEIERLRTTVAVKIANSPKLARVKALAPAWREHAATYKESRGYWSEYVSDCADELEDALEDTLGDLLGGNPEPELCTTAPVQDQSTTIIGLCKWCGLAWRHVVEAKP